MNKQPFIINLQDGEMPNLAADGDSSFGFEYTKTGIWQDDSLENIKLLNSINEKLDLIVRILQQNGRE